MLLVSMCIGPRPSATFGGGYPLQFVLCFFVALVHILIHPILEHVVVVVAYYILCLCASAHTCYGEIVE